MNTTLIGRVANFEHTMYYVASSALEQCLQAKAKDG